MSLSLGWYPTDEIEPNSLNSLLSEAKSNSFSFISVPAAVSSEETVVDMSNITDLMKWQRSLIASSDRSLDDQNDWNDRILFRIDANEINLDVYLDYAAHLSVFAVLIENWTVELALTIARNYLQKEYHYSLYFACDINKWKDWSLLSESLSSSNFAVKFYRSVGVIPVLNDKSSSRPLIWKAEPLKGIIIEECVIFENEEEEDQNDLDLVTFIQTIYKVVQLPIIIKCHRNVMSHLSYFMRSLLDPSKLDLELSLEERELREFASGFENVLQTPLQPLRDHLPSETYQVFERDPVKYRLYQEAIEEALKDIQLVRTGVSEMIKIAVFGAGRGPIVQCALEAATVITNSKVSITIVEKNPFACLTLLDRFRTYPQIRLIFADMRNLGDEEIEEESLDLIISELLGSFGDNELSPECLWSVEGLLKSDGICIPQRYTSYIEPCYSPLLRSQVVEYESSAVLAGDPFGFGFITHPTRIYLPSTTKALQVFSFSHPSPPASSNCSYQKTTATTTKLSFKLSEDCVIDGLMGYFDCFLYKNIRMSTLPSNSTPGMLSWFPIYFPLKRTKRFLLLEGSEASDDFVISVEFKRVRDLNRIWYEWRSFSSFNREEEEEFQNINGVSYSIYL